MRIAFVDHDLSPRTGSRRFTYEVACKLQSLGHEVRIFTSRLDPQKCFGKYLSLPVKVISDHRLFSGEVAHTIKQAARRSICSSMLNLVKNYGYGLRQTDFALKASRCIVEAGCDAVVLQYHGEHWLLPVFYYLKDTIGAVYLNMVPPRPRPLALPFQESTTERRLADKLLRLPPVGKWENLSMRKVALFMTPSRFQLRQAKKQRVTGRKRTAVVPLGVNHDDFLPTGEEEPFALYLGRIHPHKSLELAIMSMERTKRDYSLVIAGDVDDQNLWYAKKLSSLAERMKVADRFQLVLNPSDLQVLRLMQRCSVFLFPSTIDTFGLVALEAMACGKPVIACNKGGVPEVIGDAGFLLEPDVQQWQKTVAHVLSDSQIRRQMGEKALERSNSFSWEKTTDQLICSFDHLTDQRLD